MEFQTIVMSEGRERVIVPIPVDPDLVRGTRLRHHVTGTMDGLAHWRVRRWRLQPPHP